MRTYINAALLPLVLIAGCIGIREEPHERSVAALRRQVFEVMHDQIGRLAEERTFCCRVLEGWPTYSDPLSDPMQKELCLSLDFPRLGVVQLNGKIISGTGTSYDGRLGEEIIDSLRKCTMDDAVSLGAISNRMVRTAGLAWLGKDGSSFAGFVVIADDDVYFAFTTMFLVADKEDSYGYDIFYVEPPYYLWRNPYWAQVHCVSDWQKSVSDTLRIRRCWNKAFPDNNLLRFENFVTAFRVDVSPERFPAAAKPILPEDIECCNSEPSSRPGEGKLTPMRVSASADNASHGKVQLWKDGPYWAETNIGAEKPWDCGFHFWWGDTVGYWHDGCSWVASDGSASNFRFWHDPISRKTTEKSVAMLQSEGWITADNVLVPEHDAAHVHWGGSWRMPTHSELRDLLNKCDWVWSTTNGVNGCVVRGRGDYASKSIFLPCVGEGRCHCFSRSDVDSIGCYWSSSLFDVDPHSWSLSFVSTKKYLARNLNRRYYGQAVRPVQTYPQP